MLRLFPLFVSLFLIGSRTAAQPTEILLVGTDHLQAVYRPGNANTDAFSPVNQQGLQRVSASLARFRPEIVMVERLPAAQAGLDSLYNLYVNGTLDVMSRADGRDEVFQIAFPVARAKGLQRVFCVNAPGASSQGMLDNGDNIGIYKDSTAALRKVVRETYDGLASGKLSFPGFYRFLNRPETYNMVYRLRYVTPARVMNGTFTNPDAAVDTAFLDGRYIGAELTAVFKRRDYMIYSNILNLRARYRPKRMLLLIGTAHIGSLRSIIQDDPEFKIVDTWRFLGGD